VAPEAGRCLAGIAPEPPVELTSHTATLQENAVTGRIFSTGRFQEPVWGVRHQLKWRPDQTDTWRAPRLRARGRTASSAPEPKGATSGHTQKRRRPGVCS
jgi:hypothetical protein